MFRLALSDAVWTAPDDAVLKSELIAAKHFNPNAVDGFVDDFKDTLAYAGITDSTVLEFNKEEGESMVEAVKQTPEPNTIGLIVAQELERGRSVGDALSKAADKFRNAPLLNQTLVVSIPRDFKVQIDIRGDELRKEDLAKIRSQFNRWIEGLEEAFEE